MAFREELTANFLQLTPYSKNALPDPASHELRSAILVTDKGVGDDEFAICVNDGTNWIDIVTNAAVA